MSNHYGYTYSNTVPVTDVEAATKLAQGETIVHDHGGYEIDSQISVDNDEETIHIHSTDTEFNVFSIGYQVEKPEEFLEELSEYITEPLMIRSVGFERGWLPSAYQWSVHPNGNVVRDVLPDRTES
jgi:hypothetical protein